MLGSSLGAADDFATKSAGLHGTTSDHKESFVSDRKKICSVILVTSLIEKFALKLKLKVL